jgi:hypothetical protein
MPGAIDGLALGSPRETALAVDRDPHGLGLSTPAGVTRRDMLPVEGLRHHRCGHSCSGVGGGQIIRPRALLRVRPDDPSNARNASGRGALGPALVRPDDPSNARNASVGRSFRQKSRASWGQHR